MYSLFTDLLTHSFIDLFIELFIDLSANLLTTDLSANLSTVYRCFHRIILQTYLLFIYRASWRNKINQCELGLEFFYLMLIT